MIQCRLAGSEEQILAVQHRSVVAAVVLTHNEEGNIAKCLATLQWADELVVLDSGSTDRTTEIAQGCGARVLTHRMDPFIIADQRNWALTEGGIKAEWVLFVDADELLTAALADEIVARTAEADGSIVGFRLCFKFMFLGRWLRHVCMFPTWHDRLAKRGRVRFVGGVWERFDAETCTIGVIKEPYLHFGFSNGLSAWFERHNRYSTDRARFLFDTRRRKVDWRGLATSAQRDPRRQRQALEAVGARALWLTPLARFLFLMIIRGGVLDGWPGLVYAVMIAVYQTMICLKVMELAWRDAGRTL
jgi:glycosyltransferase involved in cell wall biosynthesis